MKLGRNASGVCAMHYKAYEGGAMKKSSVFGWDKRSKKSPQIEITN